ncbi:hypothetical protein C8A01DRAFT_15749 [Parachaetomium inaequale]|uniref:RRM domain-containing protein n=1 Tax=Parachaetomium inaequale TaxID=2588326 RepID=A0AAN6PGE7_9PEZI|nr:hypothetical protein C8A01DRAFT_15749 [Parachaetomium inaequale]
MNQIRAIQALNKREIENGVPPSASWHTDYRDTAFVYFGGLPYELSEGDVATIFSQFGEPVFLKLARDKETGKSKGFGWLKYEDQRSTDLAVDNLGGAEIGGRMVRVDHARYQVRDDEDLEECKIGWEDMLRRERAEKGLPSDGEGEDDETDEERQAARPMIKEERELQLLMQNHDDDDPMKEFLVEEKKKEVEEALRREKRRAEKEGRKHRDRDSRYRHRSHRSKRDESGDEGRDRDTYRDRGEHGNAVGILPVGSAAVKAARPKTVAAEMTATRMATEKTVIGIGAMIGKTPPIAESVGTAIWRIGDGATRGVEADRRALTEIEDASWRGRHQYLSSARGRPSIENARYLRYPYSP